MRVSIPYRRMSVLQCVRPNAEDSFDPNVESTGTTSRLRDLNHNETIQTKADHSSASYTTIGYKEYDMKTYIGMRDDKGNPVNVPSMSFTTLWLSASQPPSGHTASGKFACALPK